MLDERMPKVSVIIPTYNRVHYLKDAIESVLAQTYQDFELIVVDDGSTDNTQDIALAYGDRLRYIYQNNQGRSAARNLGAQQANGKYIAFLDSDDIWLPQKLEEQVLMLERETALIHCFTKAFISKEEKEENDDNISTYTTTHHQRAFSRGYAHESLSLECIIFTSCILVSRDIFLELEGFDKSCEPLEDWDFYLRLALNHRLAVVPKPLCLYRHHSTQSGAINLSHARIKVCQKHRVLLEAEPSATLRFKTARRNLAIQQGEAHFILGHQHEARHWLWQAVWLDPSLLYQTIWGNHWLLPHLLLSLLPARLAERVRQLKQVTRTGDTV